LQRDQLRLRDIDASLARRNLRLELIAPCQYRKLLIAFDTIAFIPAQRSSRCRRGVECALAQ
jgi:hypothetical protein